MFNININSNVPLYEQLQNRIIELTILGLLNENDPLPSIRNLAKEAGINPNTVSKAYSELEHHRIIYSIPGKGSFVAKNDEIQLTYKNKKINEFKEQASILKKLGYTNEQLLALLEEE